MKNEPGYHKNQNVRDCGVDDLQLRSTRLAISAQGIQPRVKPLSQSTSSRLGGLAGQVYTNSPSTTSYGSSQLQVTEQHSTQVHICILVKAVQLTMITLSVNEAHLYRRYVIRNSENTPSSKSRPPELTVQPTNPLSCAFLNGFNANSEVRLR